MEWYQILSLLGVGTLCSLIVTFVFNQIVNGAKARQRMNNDLAKIIDERDETIRLGIQALLRDRLIEIYQTCNKQKFAPLEVRDNFENLYERYHNLGANGVMDNIREKFLELPLEKKTTSTTKSKK